MSVTQPRAARSKRRYLAAVWSGNGGGGGGGETAASLELQFKRNTNFPRRKLSAAAAVVCICAWLCLFARSATIELSNIEVTQFEQRGDNLTTTAAATTTIAAARLCQFALFVFVFVFVFEVVVNAGDSR